MNCPKCTTEYKSSANFCRACGEKLQNPVAEEYKICPKCTFKNDQHANYCRECGQNLSLKDIPRQKTSSLPTEKIRGNAQAKDSMSVRTGKVVLGFAGGTSVGALTGALLGGVTSIIMTIACVVVELMSDKPISYFQVGLISAGITCIFVFGGILNTEPWIPAIIVGILGGIFADIFLSFALFPERFIPSFIQLISLMTLILAIIGGIWGMVVGTTVGMKSSPKKKS